MHEFFFKMNTLIRCQKIYIYIYLDIYLEIRQNSERERERITEEQYCIKSNKTTEGNLQGNWLTNEEHHWIVWKIWSVVDVENLIHSDCASLIIVSNIGVLNYYAFLELVELIEEKNRRNQIQTFDVFSYWLWYVIHSWIDDMFDEFPPILFRILLDWIQVLFRFLQWNQLVIVETKENERMKRKDSRISRSTLSLKFLTTSWISADAWGLEKPKKENLIPTKGWNLLFYWRTNWMRIELGHLNKWERIVNEMINWWK